MGEEEEQQTSEEWWDRLDQIESVERLRNTPIFSPQRVVVFPADDREQSPSLDLAAGYLFGFDAYLPPPTTPPTTEMSTVFVSDDFPKLRGRKYRVEKMGGALRLVLPNGNEMDAISACGYFFEYLKTLKRQMQSLLEVQSDLMQMMLPIETKHAHAAAHLAHFSPMSVCMEMGMMAMNGQSLITMQEGGRHFSAQQPPPILGPASFEGMAGSNLQVFGHPGQGLTMSAPWAQFSGGPPIYLAAGLNANGMAAAAMEVPNSAPSSNSNDLMQNTNSHVLLHNTDASSSMNQESSLECFLEEQRYVEIINPSMNEKIHLRLQCTQLPQPPRSPLRPEAFPNGGEIMLLHSSEPESFMEIDAASIGGKVASADVSCPAIFHSKKKNTTETPKRKCTTRRRIISEDLQPLIGLKRADAAKSLGVSVPTFKRVCRQNGITRWNGDECSLLEPKLVTNSVHENSPPEPQGVKTTLPSCKEGSISGQAEIGNPTLESSLSAQEGRLQGRFNARIVTIKAHYREDIAKFQLSSASGIVELKEEVAKRLGLELGSFNVKYQDEDRDWVLIACDADLHHCVKFSSSLGNQPIRLGVTDKVTISGTPAKAAED